MDPRHPPTPTSTYFSKSFSFLCVTALLKSGLADSSLNAYLLFGKLAGVMTPRQVFTCQESSAVPGQKMGTAVSVNSFTVNMVLSTTKSPPKVNSTLGSPCHRDNRRSPIDRTSSNEFLNAIAR